MKLEQENGQVLEGTRAVIRAGCFDGEVIVIALEDNYRDHRAAYPDEVLYAWPELPIVEELRRHDPAGLKVVHELKREFRGWIYPKGCEGFGPKQIKRCKDCGRSYWRSETSRCCECEALVTVMKVGGS